jgi:O-antigen ligase
VFVPGRKFLILLAVLFGYEVVASSWALDQELALYNTGVDSIYILVFWLVFALARSASVLQIMVFYFAFPVLSLALMSFGLWLYGTVRPDWLYIQTGNEASFGAVFLMSTLYLAAGVPFLLLGLLTKWRWVAFGALCLTWAIILGGGSRAGVVGLGVATVLTLLLIRQQTLVWMQSFLLLVLIATGSVVASEQISDVYASSLGRMQTLVDIAKVFTSGMESESITQDQDRFDMYESGIQVMRDQWLTGIGFDNFYIYFQDTTGRAIASHSILISLIGELGIVGTLIFVAFAFACLKSGYGGWKSATDPSEKHLALSAVSSLCVVLLVACFHPVLRTALIWSQLGFCAGLSKRISGDHKAPANVQLVRVRK